MAYEIIPNAILFAAIAGMLGIFFKHVPEAVEVGSKEHQNKSEIANIATPGDSKVSSGRWYTKGYPATLIRTVTMIWKPVKSAGSGAAKKSWQFILEAKDLKQGQILASKFARMVTPNTLRYTNSAVHTPMAAAEDLVKAGKYDEAEQKYFEVLKKFPHEYTAYEGLVRIYLQQKQYDNLSETLEYLVRHVPENDSYLAQYGNVLMSTRQYPQAIVAFTKSVAINPLIPSRFANLGLSYQATGDFESAESNFQKAADLEPSNVQYMVLLTDAMVKLDKREQAMELLVKAIEMLPKEAMAISEQLGKIASKPDHLQAPRK